jgi:hypothetical protein
MTFVCVALVLLLAVVQVAHVHALQSDADHCPLCVTIHAAAPVAAAPAPVIVVVPLGAPAPVAETRPAIRAWHPTLFTRPPPQACQGASALISA